MPNRSTICVYCGSSTGHLPLFAEAAAEIGAGIAQRKSRLVYGAGDKGLMGITARAALDGGADVIGVIPDHLRMVEGETERLTALIRTETMHERKKVMFATSDAFLVLPGGPGTLDEVIETLTWRQLGLHERPVVLLNVANYWDPFLALLRHLSANGFMREDFHDYYEVADTPELALDTVFAALSRSRSARQ